MKTGIDKVVVLALLVEKQTDLLLHYAEWLLAVCRRCGLDESLPPENIADAAAAKLADYDAERKTLRQRIGHAEKDLEQFRQSAAQMLAEKQAALELEKRVAERMARNFAAYTATRKEWWLNEARRQCEAAKNED